MNAGEQDELGADGAAIARVAAGDSEPEKIFYKIGEAAKLLGLPQYVLRYWETEFPFLRPRKTGSGRRIYSRADIELLRRLRRLLHEERFTIEGARRHFAAAESTDGAAAPEAPAAAPRSEPIREQPHLPGMKASDLGTRLAALRRELESLRSRLQAQRASGDD
ncbi:MAG: MerR family transcriptional regulator [Acidobacteriota bacterium]